MQLAWFVSILCAICLEGLGRRYLAAIPSAAFYFLKDILLVAGYLRFRPSPSTSSTIRYLYRGFGPFLAAAFIWTVAEIFNPEQQSFLLGLIGLRSYWLWWASPALFATVFKNRNHKDRAIMSLIAISVVVALMAAIQFSAPANSSANMYSVWNGEEIYAADTATVASTGRARVASTFSYISGFVDFTMLVPALLLSLGLDSSKPRVRRAALLGTFAAAAVVPMSGSRSSVVVGGAILLLTLWSAGLFFTTIGRRALAGSIVAVVLSVVAFPEAYEGVQSRFQDQEETVGRFEQLMTLVPPVAIAVHTYPMMGIGTGMQQNARATFRIFSPWDVEPEVGRYLVELGPTGFVLVWMAKAGLIAALLRSRQILKRAGRRGSAAAALSYAALTMVGNLTFDHYWQALYFMGCGFILSEVVAVREEARNSRLSSGLPATTVLGKADDAAA